MSGQKGRLDHTSKTYRWQNLNASVVNSNDERRSGCSPIGDVQPLVVGRHKKSDDENAPDVEQQKANVDVADGLGDVPAWVLDLSSCDLCRSLTVKSERLGDTLGAYRYNLRSDERECRLRHNS